MTKQRLDKIMVTKGIVTTRSEAENWIKLGDVKVDGKVVMKPGFFVEEDVDIKLKPRERYVSRAGLKLASVADKFHVNFKEKIVLDVGSSTGGFTDYSIKHGAKKVFAVDVGTNQLHSSLRSNNKIELYEKTDIRDFVPSDTPDIVVIDVSFVSLRQILPHIVSICGSDTIILAMVKPQFEASRAQINSSGVIKNNNVRRAILRDFENWTKDYFVILDKADSEIAGAKGNLERFYKLRISSKH